MTTTRSRRGAASRGGDDEAGTTRRRCPGPVGCPIQASPPLRPSLDPAWRLEPPRPAAARQPRSLIRVAAAPRCPHSPSSSQPHKCLLTQTGRCSPHTAAQCNSQPHSSSTQPRCCPRCSPHMPSHLLQPRSLALVAAFCPAALAAALTLHPHSRGAAPGVTWCPHSHRLL